ncbi:GNAT family N-acetyltransferase [Longispora sp. K20-0274]|uniref:GNAT family N-acetyltransferase n=1 Tax=Longispora sp. K20-0274 TaxID=3088255 RepID=UPI00399C0EF3
MTALPAGHTLSRPTEHDVPDILVMLHASDIASIGAPEFDEAQVRDILAAPDFDPALDAWLVRDADGRVVCLGYLEPEESSVFCEVYRHPDSVGDAHRPVLDLLLARCAERTREAGLSELVVRGGGVPGSEEWWLAALAGAGFAFEYQSARMTRELTGTEQAPTPPSGVVVRPMAVEELGGFHAVMVEAFATARRPYTPDDTGQWDDCLVCEVDGEWAAALRSTDQRADRGEGWVKLLGVRPAYRGRGLGRLLLETAFAGHAARGRTATGLGVDTSNPTGAYQLYQSVGMATAYAANICQLTLRV